MEIFLAPIHIYADHQLADTFQLVTTTVTPMPWSPG